MDSKPTKAAKAAWSMDRVLGDVATKRLRHIGKGYGAEHDDGYPDGTLEAVGAYLALANGDELEPGESPTVPIWAISLRAKYGRDRRGMLVDAAAFIVAAIERLDRKAGGPRG